jgi:hypothetical protein
VRQRCGGQDMPEIFKAVEAVCLGMLYVDVEHRYA